MKNKEKSKTVKNPITVHYLVKGVWMEPTVSDWKNLIGTAAT